VTQILSAIATHSLALVVYPGLLTISAFGLIAEIAWTRVRHGAWVRPARERPSLVVATVALFSMLVAVQLAAPFNPLPSAERNVIVAAIVLASTLWVELALSVEFVPAPGLLLVIQFCWLLAVLGPAVQPESLRPQVLGNVLVSSLLPVKIASGFLYLLCLPALLRLWPLTPPSERRLRPRIDTVRALCWLPYCGLFTTLFFPPSADDALGVVRFFVITLAVAVLCLVAGTLLVRRGAEAARGLYRRAVAPYAVVVLAVVVITSFLLR
jgi:NADH:ubiquinone oxidoreductase subunit 6 (subunit J)